MPFGSSTAAPIHAQVAAQARYHRELFAGLLDWDAVWDFAVEMAGDTASAAALGIDQLGHLGPPGVALVADRLLTATDGGLARIVELGSGFGGALRQLARILRERGRSPALIGVELVPEHRALAATAGLSVGDNSATIVTADVRSLPLAATSVDAVFACGSASHFFDMGDVLVEARRVLRPGGVIVMTDEVGLRPPGRPAVGADFLRHHPPDVFPPATPARRWAEFDDAGLAVEAFESLATWAAVLLRERIQALRFLQPCAVRMFGAPSYDRLVATLAAAAAEYERGSVQPTLIVSRRPATVA